MPSQSPDARVPAIDRAREPLSPKEIEADLRVAWEDAPERKNAVKRIRWIVALGACWYVAMSLFLGLVVSEDAAPTSSSLTFAVVIFLFFPALCFWTWALSTSRRARRIFDDRRLLGRAKDMQVGENQLALESSGSGSIDFPALWASNQRRIDYYHDIATKQSRDSFRNGQIAAYVGFTVVILVAAIAAFTNSGTGAIAASVIGVAGAGLSAYVGATFMRAQSESSAQLREYFLQPVEFSRILGAERLIQTLPDDQRAQAVQEIVKSVMQVRESKGD